ncbi:type VI secretion system tube protein Hcp [Ferruginibacter sp. SUN106]|uniref:type VI secretion system tube protein Hcp n=1 Tax=Ferruginibacter sp. SUN106 TaxID=2978348 RepID=UPI003D36E9D6
MKKLLSSVLLFTIFCLNANAQFSTYIRLTEFSGQVLTTSGMPENSAELKGNNFDPSSNQFIKVSSFKNDIEQTLSIVSTTNGAGAGKITFNDMHIIKTMDALTPTLMQNSCSGTPFKTVEVFFVTPQNIIFAKYIYKLAGIRTMAWTNTCPNGCTTLSEEIGFEYGSEIISINRAGLGEGKSGTLQAGWNRVKNVADNDPNAAVR